MTQFRPWIPVAIPPRATTVDFENAARQLGCTPAEIRAVWKVEAAGRPFRSDNSVERRFEPHHFPRKLWPDIGFTVRKGEAPWRASLRQSNDRIAEKAYEVDADAMLTASSWGAPQIIGFNYMDAGAASPRDMVDKMTRGEREHLKAFTTLINNWGLASAIRAHDWETFARRYNGPGQVNHYSNLLERAIGVASTQKHAAKLEAASRIETGKASNVVLRLGSEGRSVRKLQAEFDLKVDGVFGRNTEQAVKGFQRDNGLIVDGIVGERTWRAIEAARGAATKNVAKQAKNPPKATAASAAIGATVPAIIGGLGVTPAAWPWVVGAGVAGIVLAAVIWRSRR